MNKNIIIAIVVIAAVAIALGLSNNQTRAPGADEPAMGEVNNETMQEGEQSEEVNDEMEATEDVSNDSMLPAGNFTLADDQSTVRWEGSKVIGGAHFGVIPTTGGELMIDETGSFTGGRLALNPAGITVDDLEGESQQRLLDHLNGEDFLHTAEFPEASFNLVSMTPNEDSTYTATGNLTLRGVTAPFTAVVQAMPTENGVKVTGDFELDRTNYGIEFQSESLLDIAQEAAIKDTVMIELDLMFVPA